jgi:hypothetical protein
MGLQDYNDRLYPVYRHATDISKMHYLPFSFKVDSGNYETSIVFNLETGSCRKGNENETPDDVRYPEKMIVPDVCDYEHKIIVEFDEETGNRRTGAKYAKKAHGHEGDLPGKKDSRRNECYNRAEFHFHQVWESKFKKKLWTIPLTEFLFYCYRKSLNDSMTLYEKIPNIEN